MINKILLIFIMKVENIINYIYKDLIIMEVKISIK
jgi:hypothetical protein